MYPCQNMKMSYKRLHNTQITKNILIRLIKYFDNYERKPKHMKKIF